MSFQYQDVCNFLYREAELLDERDWDAWIELYCKDVEFWVPSWDDDGEQTQDPMREVSLMYYPRRDGLEDRIFRIQTEKSSASSPAHRTGHHLSNIRVVEQDDTHCDVRFNWITYTMRYKVVDQYFGTSHYRLVHENDQLRIRKKKVILKNDCIHHVIDIYHI